VEFEALDLNVMGSAALRELEDIEKREAAWDRLCRFKGLSCRGCGEVPMFEEREEFFEEGRMCAHCLTLYGHRE
jgi:hypothetical protein